MAPKTGEIATTDPGTPAQRHIGRRIVLTAPFTETIDHAGFFIIQMSMASLPVWLEGILNRKYPNWRKVEHNPDGSARTMPAGLIFGESRQPINVHYARQLFQRVKQSPYRSSFQVIVGGSGGWQISQTHAWDDLGVDCVVEGRSESADTMALFDRALAGERLPRQIDVGHPKDRDSLVVPARDRDGRIGTVGVAARPLQSATFV